MINPTISMIEAEVDGVYALSKEVTIETGTPDP